MEKYHFPLDITPSHKKEKQKKSDSMWIRLLLCSVKRLPCPSSKREVVCEIRNPTINSNNSILPPIFLSIKYELKKSQNASEKEWDNFAIDSNDYKTKSKWFLYFFFNN